jgi:hypothetical protein
VLNAVAICITMQSMLASNKKKERYVASRRVLPKTHPLSVDLILAYSSSSICLPLCFTDCAPLD